MNRYAITLKDGRTVIFEEANEEAAARAAERWQALNPPGQPVSYYEITLESGEKKRVPAVSEDAAAEFASVWGPQQRALENARSIQDTAGYDATSNAANVTTFGADKILSAALAAGATGLDNLFGEGPGYGMRDAFDATRQAQNEAQEQWSEDQPLQAGLSGLLGALATPGGAQVGKWVAGADTGGLLSSRLLPTTARAATAGAGSGSVRGLLNSTPGDEVGDTLRGGAIEAATAGVLPVAASAATGTVRGIGRLLDRGDSGAGRRAAQRLVEAMQQDGLTPDQIRTGMNEWMRSGVTPSLLDLAPRGGATQRLVRGAAMKAGDASRQAEDYASQVASDLQDNAIGLTRQLTPDRRTSSDLVEQLTQQRRSQGLADYAPVQGERVPVTPEVMSALADAPGRAAMQRARSAAVDNRFTDQVEDLDRLMAGEAQDIGAGTLDRIRRAMAGRAEDMYRSGRTKDSAPGLFQRADDIDSALNDVEALGPARDNYRLLSRQLEAVEEGGKGLTANPVEFAFPKDVLPQAQVGYREALENAIGRPTEGATGVLNRIGTSTNQRQNLQTVFPEGADTYRQGIQNLTQQMNNARFVASSSGSQTAGRLADEGLVQMDSLPRGPISLITTLIDKVRRGATLTDADRAEIARLGLSQADPSTLPNPRLQGTLVSGRLAPMLGSLAGSTYGQ